MSCKETFHTLVWGLLNPIALRMAKTLWSFGCSECTKVKVYGCFSTSFIASFTKRHDFSDFLFASLDKKTFQNEVFFFR